MCDWRKLLRRVTSRPEIEIADQRSAFSSQTPSIEPSYKTGPKHVKIKISPIAQGFSKKFRVQHVALTVRRPKHPCLVRCNPLFQVSNRTIVCILKQSASLYGDCMVTVWSQFVWWLYGARQRYEPNFLCANPPTVLRVFLDASRHSAFTHVVFFPKKSKYWRKYKGGKFCSLPIGSTIVPITRCPASP